MASVLDSGASSSRSSPGWGHSVVFLGEALNSHSAFLSQCLSPPRCINGNWQT